MHLCSHLAVPPLYTCHHSTSGPWLQDRLATSTSLKGCRCGQGQSGTPGGVQLAHDVAHICGGRLQARLVQEHAQSLVVQASRGPQIHLQLPLLHSQAAW